MKNKIYYLSSHVVYSNMDPPYYEHDPYETSSTDETIRHTTPQRDRRLERHNEK